MISRFSGDGPYSDTTATSSNTTCSLRTLFGQTTIVAVAVYAVTAAPSMLSGLALLGLSVTLPGMLLAGACDTRIVYRMLCRSALVPATCAALTLVMQVAWLGLIPENPRRFLDVVCTKLARRAYLIGFLWCLVPIAGILAVAVYCRFVGQK